VKLRFLHRAVKARWRDQKLEIALARAFIQPGDTVVDAGANKGAYTYWLRRFAGRTGRVLAYEPQPSLAQYLERARAAFRWENVEVRQAALSDTPGTARLYVPGGEVSPGASLEESAGGESYECAVTTLDRDIAGAALKFLKVDVEGHELSLFRGARQLLEKEAPPILFECEARHLAKHSMTEVFDFLKSLDYEGWLLHGSRLLPLAQFDPAIHQKNSGSRFWDAPDYFNNFLFCHAEAAAIIARIGVTK
jgi:FkbM family methyltransferase